MGYIERNLKTNGGLAGYRKDRNGNGRTNAKKAKALKNMKQKKQCKMAEQRTRFRILKPGLMLRPSSSNGYDASPCVVDSHQVQGSFGVALQRFVHGARSIFAR